MLGVGSFMETRHERFVRRVKTRLEYSPGASGGVNVAVVIGFENCRENGGD